MFDFSRKFHVAAIACGMVLLLSGQSAQAITTSECGLLSGTIDTGTCYVADTATQFWNAHEANAQSLHSDLHIVSIHSFAQNTFVRNFATANLTPNQFYIGLTDQAVEGVFVWADGSPLDYQNWNSGEPNDYGSGEDFTEMYSNGLWNDIFTSSQPRMAVYSAAIFNPPPPAAVSEPATLAIFGLGLAGLGYMRRKRAA